MRASSDNLLAPFVRKPTFSRNAARASQCEGKSRRVQCARIAAVVHRTTGFVLYFFFLNTFFMCVITSQLGCCVKSRVSRWSVGFSDEGGEGEEESVLYSIVSVRRG